MTFLRFVPTCHPNERLPNSDLGHPARPEILGPTAGNQSKLPIPGRLRRFRHPGSHSELPATSQARADLPSELKSDPGPRHGDKIGGIFVCPSGRSRVCTGGPQGAAGQSNIFDESRDYGYGLHSGRGQ